MKDNPPPAHGEIQSMYDAFNNRELDRLAAYLSETVNWPNGEARLHGVAAVRDYWSALWARIHVHDAVVGVTETGSGRTAVRISQVVRDLDGEVVSRGAFEHTYTFSNGLVQRMDLRGLSPETKDQVMTDDTEFLRMLYAAFNRRDIPAAVAMMDDEVEWANGQLGGHVHGREAVRAYWTNQWVGIQPRVDPLDITRRDEGVMAVEVHQVVHDLAGKLLLDEKVRHVFLIEDSLVVRFDIENAGGLVALAHD